MGKAKELSRNRGGHYRGFWRGKFGGYYPEEVITGVLQDKGYKIEVLVNPLATVDNLDEYLGGRSGFILNVDTKPLGFFNGNHWLAMRKLNGKWYNFDSKLDVPKLIGSDADLKAVLRKRPDLPFVKEFGGQPMAGRI